MPSSGAWGCESEVLTVVQRRLAPGSAAGSARLAIQLLRPEGGDLRAEAATVAATQLLGKRTMGSKRHRSMQGGLLSCGGSLLGPLQVDWFAEVSARLRMRIRMQSGMCCIWA
jgi:hypothetical protein